MSLRRKLMMLALVPLAGAAIYKQRAALGLGASVESELLELERVSNRGARVSLEAVRAAAEAQPDADGFKRVLRPGSVDIQKEYNLAGLTIPKEQIHTLLPRDAIPALTNPKTEPADKAAWLPDDARIIEIVVGADVLGVPLRVLDWHEIVNTTVGGEPIAATYCPLCDSATVFSRRVTPATPKDASGDGSGTKPSTAPAPIVLEFGVSGALYNSNVLMYDKKDKGLWSQLGMHALSGPLTGTALEMLPVEVVSFAAFKKAHRGAKIVSKDTGHNRDYTKSPYESYFKNENLMVPVAGVGDALPRKTLGVGIAFGEGDTARAWFVPVSAIGDARTIDTPAGAGKTEGVFIVHCRTPRAAAHQPEGLAESSRGVERGVRAERHPRSRSRGRMQAEGLLAASIPRRARAALGAAENQRQRGEWVPLSGGVAALHAPATDVQAFGLERGITPLRLAEAKRETATAVRDA